MRVGQTRKNYPRSIPSGLTNDAAIATMRKIAPQSTASRNDAISDRLASYASSGSCDAALSSRLSLSSTPRRVGRCRTPGLLSSTPIWFLSCRSRNSAEPRSLRAVNRLIVRIPLRQHVPLGNGRENSQRHFQNAAGGNRFAARMARGNLFLGKVLPNPFPLFVAEL